MTQLTWDATGNHLYETGVDRGVLYIPDSGGAYSNGVAWNGLTAVTETPSGAASTPMYADNGKYLNLISAEDFGADLEAYTYPAEFQAFDGLGVPSNGIALSQQDRGVFGLSYRTKIGNDIDGDSHGYKLHLVYGCQAAPSQKAYTTINDKPTGIVFKWTITTTPVAVSGTYNSKTYKNTALLTVDSTQVSATGLTALEAILYGASGNPLLPTPDSVITTLTASLVTVSALTVPTYTRPTLTIPTLTGVDYFVNGVKKTTAQTLTTGQTVEVSARAQAGYVFGSNILDNDWQFSY